jgi:hypothetical protein
MWKKVLPRVTPFEFHTEEIPENETEELNPLSCFLKYLPVNLFDDAAFYTNLYSVQNGTKLKPTDGIELMKLFGLHILIGTLGNFSMFMVL